MFYIIIDSASNSLGIFFFFFFHVFDQEIWKFWSLKFAFLSAFSHKALTFLVIDLEEFHIFIVRHPQNHDEWTFYLWLSGFKVTLVVGK